MRSLLLVAVIFGLCSCGIFSADVEPAEDALAQLQTAHQRAHERESYLASQITDPAARATWEERIATEWTAIGKLTDALADWIDAVGEINWRRLYEQARNANASARTVPGGGL